MQNFRTLAQPVLREVGLGQGGSSCTSYHVKVKSNPWFRLGLSLTIIKVLCNITVEGTILHFSMTLQVTIPTQIACLYNYINPETCVYCQHVFCVLLNRWIKQFQLQDLNLVNLSIERQKFAKPWKLQPTYSQKEQEDQGGELHASAPPSRGGKDSGVPCVRADP